MVIDKIEIIGRNPTPYYTTRYYYSIIIATMFSFFLTIATVFAIVYTIDGAAIAAPVTDDPRSLFFVIMFGFIGSFFVISLLNDE